MLFYDSITEIEGKFNANPKRFEAILAIPGVFPYKVGDKTVYHYRPIEEIFSDQTVESLNDALVTIDHPVDDLNPVNGVGAVIEIRRDSDKKALAGSLLLLNQDALNLAKSGSQVSPKFEADVIENSGIWYDSDGNAHPYDAIQKNIRYRSLGLVGKHGRQGDTAKIYRQLSADSNTAVSIKLPISSDMNTNEDSGQLLSALQKMIQDTKNGQMVIPTHNNTGTTATSNGGITIQDDASTGIAPSPVSQPSNSNVTPNVQPGLTAPQSHTTAPLTATVQPGQEPIQIDPTSTALQGNTQQTQPAPSSISSPNQQTPTTPPDPTTPVPAGLNMDGLSSALQVAQTAVNEGLGSDLSGYLFQALKEPDNLKIQILQKNGITLADNTFASPFFDGFMAAKKIFHRKPGRSKKEDQTMQVVAQISQAQQLPKPVPIQPVQYSMMADSSTDTINSTTPLESLTQSELLYLSQKLQQQIEKNTQGFQDSTQAIQNRNVSDPFGQGTLDRLPKNPQPQKRLVGNDGTPAPVTFNEISQ